LAELDLFHEVTGEMPLLLLDDVFSELDEDRRARLLGLVGRCQCIITATSMEGLGADVRIFNVVNGGVI